MFTFLDPLRELTFASLCFKLILAVIIPTTLGIERERAHHYSSISTYCLVTLGAAITMILSSYESYLFTGPWLEQATEIGIRTDVSRFGAQVINGIGFLGAGAIIVTGGKDVKGLTTAAGLWSSACLGLAIGVGFYECVIVGFTIMFFTMHYLTHLQEYAISHSKHLNLYIEISDVRAVTDIVEAVNNLQSSILNLEFHKTSIVVGDEKRNPAVTLMLVLPNSHLRPEMVSNLSAIRHVRSLEEL